MPRSAARPRQLPNKSKKSDTKIELDVEVPALPEQEKAVAVAKEAYSSAKASLREPTGLLSELQQQRDDALAANPKAKPDPDVEAKLEELAAVVAECEQKADAAKQKMRAAERLLLLEQQRIYVKLRSEKTIKESRSNADSYAKDRDDANTSIASGLDFLKAEAKREHLEAQKAAKEKARVDRVMHFDTHLDTFALGFRTSWAQGKPFPPAPRVPPTVWAPPDPPPLGEPPALTALKQKLGASFYRVIDLFTKWDVDHDHTISKFELQNALGALNIPHTDASLDALFENLDEDHSGTIDFEELHKAPRKHVPKRLPPNQISLEVPKRREPLPDGTGAERRAVAALKKALHTNYGKISTLFMQWDKDGDGQISKGEVKRALAAQCIPVDDRSLATLFHKIDKDGSGGIELNELHRMLRREFVFDTDISAPRILSVDLGVDDGRPTTADRIQGLSASQPKLGERAKTPQQLQKELNAKRSAFDRKVRRHDHADLAVIFAEREAAARTPPPGVAAPPSAATMTRSQTEPKLVQR